MFKKTLQYPAPAPCFLLLLEHSFGFIVSCVVGLKSDEDYSLLLTHCSHTFTLLYCGFSLCLITENLLLMWNFASPAVKQGETCCIFVYGNGVRPLKLRWSKPVLWRGVPQQGAVSCDSSVYKTGRSMCCVCRWPVTSDLLQQHVSVWEAESPFTTGSCVQLVAPHRANPCGFQKYKHLQLFCFYMKYV